MITYSNNIYIYIYIYIYICSYIYIYILRQWGTPTGVKGLIKHTRLNYLHSFQRSHVPEQEFEEIYTFFIVFNKYCGIFAY